MSMLVVQNVAKSYGDIQAVNNASLRLEPGEIYGLLGPNGAGKTTLMRIIAGLLPFDTGTVEVAGYNVATAPRKARRAVGFVPDTPFIYRYLTGREYLEFLFDLWQLDPEQKYTTIATLLDQFSLVDRANTLVASYSHGMRQKLAFAGALLPDPQILVLDEPLTGFDPPSYRLMKTMLHSFADMGRVVLLSTHILEIAKHMCDRVGVLVDGTIISEERHFTTMTAFEDFVITAMER